MTMLRVRSLHVPGGAESARLTVHAVVDNDVYPPLFGSTQRSFGLLRGLAREHDAQVLCVVPWRNHAPREQSAENVQVHRRRAWYTTAAWRLEQTGLSPLFLAAHGHAAHARRLLGALSGAPDALLVGPWFGGLLAHSKARIKVYASQNVEYDHFRMTAPRMLGRSRWAEHARSIEQRLVREADYVIACSHEDILRMQSLYGLDPDRALLATNGYDELAIRPPTADERRAARAALGLGDARHVGIFLGSDAATNREALDLLLRHVAPHMDAAEFCLIVAGEISAHVGESRPECVVTQPSVPDVLPLLHAADVGLNPVTVGGGSNVKVPTYLGAGLAVLTTEYGLRGYESLEPFCVATALDGFADAWQARPRGWAAAGRSAPEPVVEHQWGAIGQRLGRELAQLVVDAARDVRPAAAAQGRITA